MTYYVLVVIELSSRKVPKRLINETCSKQGIVSGQLTLHADRGTSMKSKPLAMLLSDLGVTKTHSRPHVSNDNPYSESQFKTLKYRPEFPKRFGSIQHARDVCRDLFGWYNTEHYHSGIGLLTPESVHYGRAATIVEGRKQVLLDFFGAHPERFVKGTPKPPEITLSGVDQSHRRRKRRIRWAHKPRPRPRTTYRYPSFAPFTGIPSSPTRSASVTRRQQNHAGTPGNPA